VITVLNSQYLLDYEDGIYTRFILTIRGQPSSPFSSSDVILVLSTSGDPEPEFFNGLDALMSFSVRPATMGCYV